MNRDSNILITGATGLVGSYLARMLLYAGYTSVTGLKRKSSGTELLGNHSDRISWIETDITTCDWYEVLKDVKYVFHCAALISHARADREKMFRTNTQATANLVNACLDRNVRRLVFVSSVAALHRDAENPMVDPDSTFVRNHLTSDYGWTKHLAEMEVWRGHAEGLPVNVITPTIILGSGKWNDGSTAIFKNVWQGVPFYPKGGNGFVDVRDVAALCLKAMLGEKTGERIIANAANLTYEELFGLIAPALGVKTPRKPLSNTFAHVYIVLRQIKEILSGQRTIVKRQSIMIAQHRFLYPNDKSRTLFDFEYRPIEETIRQTAGQFREAADRGFEPMFLPLDEPSHGEPGKP